MKKKILIYVRSVSKELLYNMVRTVFPCSDIYFFADSKKISDFWTGDYIYDSRYDGARDSLSDEEISDIISRDRSLRGNLLDVSNKLVVRLWNGVEELFERMKFDYFFTTSVDCYTIDILLRASNKNNVRAISFLGSFLSGYVWFNLRGERNPLCRNVSEEEVQKVYNNLIQKMFLPGSEVKHVEQKPRDIISFYYRRKMVEDIYYPFRRLIERDKWNCYYNMCNWKKTRLSDYYNRKYDSYFSHINEIEIDRNNSVYFPLHYIPEATTDYWCEDISRYGYEEYVFKVIEESSALITWIVKEHPAMYGKRKLSFYDKLRKINNVIVIHPLDRSNDLVEKIDTVVVDNGTVGVESVIRGKRVIALSKNYYEELHPNIYRRNRVSIEDLSLPINEYDNIKFIRDLLDGLFTSDYSNNKWQAKANVDELVIGLQMLIRVKGWN